jgi:hypothetical protein
MVHVREYQKQTYASKPHMHTDTYSNLLTEVKNGNTWIFARQSKDFFKNYLHLTYSSISSIPPGGGGSVDT